MVPRQIAGLTADARPDECQRAVAATRRQRQGILADLRRPTTSTLASVPSQRVGAGSFAREPSFQIPTSPPSCVYSA
jgi:hypothetical protein